jgi:hypothetical protein
MDEIKFPLNNFLSWLHKNNFFLENHVPGGTKAKIAWRYKKKKVLFHGE